MNPKRKILSSKRLSLIFLTVISIFILIFIFTRIKENRVFSTYKKILKEENETSASDGVTDINAQLFAFAEENIDRIAKDQREKLAKTILDRLDTNLFVFSERFNEEDLSQYSLEELRDTEKMQKTDLRYIYQNGYLINAYVTHYQLIIDFDRLLKLFKGKVNPAYIDYFEIGRTESLLTVEDGSRSRVSNDELVKRILNTERFIKKYPRFYKIVDLKDLNHLYLFLYIGESLDESQIKNQLAHYKQTRKKYGRSKLAKTLKGYIAVIEKNEEKVTGDVSNYARGLMDAKVK